jgi:predicted membrane protein
LIGAVVYDIQGPIFRQQAVMLLAWIPVLALVKRRVLASVGPWAYSSAVFYFLNTMASMLLGDQLLYRSVLLALNLLMLLTLAWRMLRARRHAADEAGPMPVWALTLLGWVACAVLLRIGRLQRPRQHLTGDDAHRRAARQPVMPRWPCTPAARCWWPCSRSWFPARRWRASPGAIPAR